VWAGPGHVGPNSEAREWPEHPLRGRSMNPLNWRCGVPLVGEEVNLVWRSDDYRLWRIIQGSTIRTRKATHPTKSQSSSELFPLTLIRFKRRRDPRKISDGRCEPGAASPVGRPFIPASRPRLGRRPLAVFSRRSDATGERHRLTHIRLVSLPPRSSAHHGLAWRIASTSPDGSRLDAVGTSR
jgi:hypothetical protein